MRTGTAYVYCIFQPHEEQNPEDPFVSVLKQLAQARFLLPNPVKAFHNKHKSARPESNDTLQYLQPVAARHSKGFIVVDALEHQASDGYAAGGIWDLESDCTGVESG